MTSKSAALAAWVQPQHFATGVSPSIAYNNHDTVVGVYARKDPNNGNYFYYDCFVGKADDKSISWGQKFQVAHVSAENSEGMARVALNDNNLLIVVWDSRYKMYAVGGSVDPVAKTVSFGQTNEWDSGMNPSVALNNSNIAVETHQGDDNPLRIYYSVGSIDPNTKWVSFRDSKHYDSGHRPSVSVNNANYVIESHETTAATYSLWCTVGKIQDDREHIDFGDPQDYDNGMRPSVSLNDANEVMQVHWASAFSTEVWSRPGRIDTTYKTSSWNDAWNYDHGAFASCAMNNARAVVGLNQTEQLGDTLVSHVGKYYPG